MSDTRRLNEKYAAIGAALIESDDLLIDIRNSHATIAYLSSDAQKMDRGRVVYGQCEKVAEKYKWGIPADFTVTLFEPNVEGKSEESIRRIILHELLHVGITFNGDGSEDYNITPHDIEDFKALIDRWGTDWSEV